MDPQVKQPSQPVNSQTSQQQMAPQDSTSLHLPKIFVIIVGIIICLGLIVGAYYLGTKNIPKRDTNRTNQTKVVITVPTVITTALETVVTNWKTYSNTIYNQKISFKYPVTWSIANEGYSKNQPGYTINFCSRNTTSTSDCHAIVYAYKINEAGPSSLKEIKDNLTETAKSGNFNVNFTNMTIGSQPGQKITYSNLPALEINFRKTEYDIINNGVMYIFTVESETDANDIDTLVNTIQFFK